MIEKERIVRRLIYSTAVLVGVNMIRQVYERSHTGHQIYWLSFAAYILLLTGWCYAIRLEIVHKRMRRCLYGQAAVIYGVVVIRLVQEVYLRGIYEHALVQTGYYLTIAAVLIPLFGLYGVLYLGYPEDYQLDRRWQLLWIPASLFMVAAATNDVHHLIAEDVMISELETPEFHIGIVGVMMFAWIIGLTVYSTKILIEKNGTSKKDPLYIRFVPFYEPVLLILFSFPYIMDGFKQPPFELMEYSVGMLFIVILCWQLYVLFGLIPVNTKYEEVFRRSTTGMQIIDEHGYILAAAETAEPINQGLFQLLLEQRRLYTKEDKEMHLYNIPGGFLVWENDLSLSNRLLRELQETNQGLEQEGFLLAQELRVSSGEANIQLRNEIYDGLTKETEKQLQLLNSFLEEEQETDPVLWGKISLVGTYIKRYCNLRLTYQEVGEIPREDFEICMKDMVNGMNGLGIAASLKTEASAKLTSAQILHGIRTLEDILEQYDFALEKMDIYADENIVFSFCGKDNMIRAAAVDREGKAVNV